MKTLLLDVDGVVADCATPVHNFAQRYIERDLPTPAEWRDFDFSISMGLSPVESALFRRNILNSDVAWQIDLYPGAARSVNKLCKAFEVVFVTSHWANYPAWVPARDELLARFGRPIVYTHDKWLVRGDYLVDDRPLTLSDTRGQWAPVRFVRPWNMNVLGLCVSTLDQLLQYAP